MVGDSDNYRDTAEWHQILGADFDLHHKLHHRPVDRFAASKALAIAKATAIPSRLATSQTAEIQDINPTAVNYDSSYSDHGVRGGYFSDNGNERQQNLTGAGDLSIKARELARSAANLEQLRQIMTDFDGCGLKKTATQLVFGDGNPNSRLMLIGEAPGREEDIQGRPFVGRSGQLLDKMLAAIGLTRRQYYIANIVPWRPPGNRTPGTTEIAICQPFIERQIALIKPDFLLLLGGAAAQHLLDVKGGILRLRGRWYSYNGDDITIKTLATFHPAYLLRQPGQKALAWQDMLLLKQALA